MLTASLLSGCGGGDNEEATAAGFTIGGTVDGLASGQQVTLLNNGDDPLVLGNGKFTFKQPIARNGSYSVTVGAQPTGQVCTVSNGNGAGVVADVSNVSVTCSARTYTVSGTLTGLASGQQVTLKNNDADPVTRSVDGPFSFTVPIAHKAECFLVGDRGYKRMSRPIEVGPRAITKKPFVLNRSAGGGVYGY